MYSPKYVWVLPSSYKENWWRNASSKTNCTDAQMAQVVNGYVTVGINTLNENTQQTTIAGEVRMMPN